MIYLDNAATTQMSKKALEVYSEYATSRFFNPSATYISAVEMSQKLDEAREKLKKMLGAKKGDIIFTSGATESNNLAVRGSLREGKWDYVFSQGEHASIHNLAIELEREGKCVSTIRLTKTGEIDYENLEHVLTPKTRLVSCMLVNNVTGVINDIAKLSKIVRKHSPNAVIHVDGVQAFRKIDFSVDKLDIDLLSISAHKFHGPKGVGALYVRNKAALKSLVYGGGQEYGIRSGTENVAGIMAMVAAAEEINVAANYKKVTELKKVFLKQFEGCDKVTIVGENTSPYICLMLFRGVNGETLVRALENQVIVGRGSACSSKKSGNHVLEAMGQSLQAIKGAVRVSFDASLSEKDVTAAANIIEQTYLDLWEKLK